MNGKFGVIDIKKTLVDFKYDKIEYPFSYPDLSSPFLIVEKSGKKFYIDFNGIEYIQ